MTDCKIIVVGDLSARLLAAKLSEVDGVTVDIIEDDPYEMNQLRACIIEAERVKEYISPPMRFDTKHNGHPKSPRKTKKR